MAANYFDAAWPHPITLRDRCARLKRCQLLGDHRKAVSSNGERLPYSAKSPLPDTNRKRGGVRIPARRNQRHFKALDLFGTNSFTTASNREISVASLRLARISAGSLEDHNREPICCRPAASAGRRFSAGGTAIDSLQHGSTSSSRWRTRTHPCNGLLLVASRTVTCALEMCVCQRWHRLSLCHRKARAFGASSPDARRCNLGLSVT